MKRTPRPKILTEPIAESSGDWIQTLYWIKIGVPRSYLPRLKQLGIKFGARSAPVASAARIVTLLGLLHPEKNSEWLKQVERETLYAVQFSSQYKGSDAAQN